MHEQSITVERDGRHFIESGVVPEKVLEGPFNSQEEADTRARARSSETPLSKFRVQHPQYNDLDDSALADALYKKFYSDMPRDQFEAKLGIAQQAAAPTAAPTPAERDAQRRAGTQSVMAAQLPEGLTPEQAQENLQRFAMTPDMMARTVASGATFGLADEAAAGMNTLTGGKPYSENLAAERARDASIPPAVRMTGELAGGALTGMGLGRQGVTMLNAARPTIQIGRASCRERV